MKLTDEPLGPGLCPTYARLGASEHRAPDTGK